MVKSGAVLVAIWFLSLGLAQATPAISRGVNFGDALETPKEGAWGVILQADYFRSIKQAGFDTVRVPILWIAHTGPAPDYTIDPAFFQRIDWVVQQAIQNQLNVILDYHYDPELMKEPDAFATRFITIWKQIAAHYANAPDSVFFELLNEPFDKLDSGKWNQIVAEVIPQIRAASSPAAPSGSFGNNTRTIIVGPVQWNSFEKLPELKLPESDHHLLVTFHYYLPMEFTHQGASWIQGSNAWLGTRWDGTDAQKAVIAYNFGVAADWAKAHHRPLFLGEFGAYSTGDMDSRARWISCCARTAESLDIGWSYWEFCAGFGAYDPVAHHWRVPLLRALIPGGIGDNPPK